MTLSLPARLRHLLFLAILTAAFCAATGCSVFNRSSLATNSGQTASRSIWSIAPEQWVHVGEKIDISYEVTSGMPDYAILQIDALDFSKVSLVSEAGRFYFQNLSFQEPTPPGKPLKVKAFSYRQRDERDHMDLDGKLLSRESISDVPDALVSSAQMRLHIYQAKIAMTVYAVPTPYRWETATLALYADADRPVQVSQERPYRQGFRIAEPDAAGAVQVTYEPLAGQIKRTGATRVVLTVRDEANAEHREELLLPTP